MFRPSRAEIGGERFFDGFGFEAYSKQFGWAHTALDEHEARHKPKNPLLPYLAQLSKKLPKKWDPGKRKMVADDDWLLWDLHPKKEGAEVAGPRKGRK